MTRSKRATSTDVARVAGVSRTTVSFVLNNRGDQSIPEETRRRVRAAAALLDYRPHSSARSLAAGRSDVVLLAVPDLPIGPSITRFVEQLAAALTEHGLTLVTHLASAGGRSLPDVCATVGASAVIGFGGFDSETVATLHRAGAQVVTPADAAEGGTGPVMGAVGRLQAEHLVDRGHRRLGYAMPAHPAYRDMARERLDGVAAFCRDAGLDEPLTLTVGLDVDEAADAVGRWKAASVTAVCAFNDETAIAVLAGAHASGVPTPSELAVIGVDDVPTAALTVPALSTVTFDLHELGRHRARSVAAALTGGPAPPTPGTPRELRVVHRSST